VNHVESSLDKSTFVLILASVLLSSLAQIVLKGGVSGASAAAPAAAGDTVRGALTLALSWRVWLGLVIYFASAVVWLSVLARIPVGLAYPFVGLGFVITMLLAWLIRGEIPSLMQVLGTCTICFGVFLMSRA
jgi:multidrug transporter EmrE-like cation transporter